MNVSGRSARRYFFKIFHFLLYLNPKYVIMKGNKRPKESQPLKKHAYIKNILVTIAILCISFLLSLLFQNVFDVNEHITTVFVFAVFLISLLTDGYVYGLAAAIVGTIAVNYAFTFPFFALNFTIPVNLISAVIMIVIAVLTGTLTTQVKRNEAIKAESEKEKMRADLLRAVSHDLRTPLTTIYGSASTLLEGKENFTEDQQYEMLKHIKEDSEWLTRIVENLLSITKIDSGKVKIIKTPTVLDELIDSVIVKFKKRYPTQAVTLDLPDEIVAIPMDAILIEQVLLNLLENAVQHAAGMTELSLKVSAAENYAVFEIKDNGCGIREDRLKRIFSGYYEAKGEPADSRKKNNGIGLSVCATIIKAHGGRITAENADEGGAVFRFTLGMEEHENE